MASLFRVRVKGGESLSYLNLISIAVAVTDAINLCDAAATRQNRSIKPFPYSAD